MNKCTDLYDAACRFHRMDRSTTILYFGDFDPSGEDICRALGEGLSFFGIEAEVEKVALARDDVITYNLAT